MEPRGAMPIARSDRPAIAGYTLLADAAGLRRDIEPYARSA